MRMFLRLNHLSSDVSNRFRDESVTFGHLTFCIGLRFWGVGYGWCAHASKRMRGFAAATSCAKRPGECVADLPFSGLSRPCDEVEPSATRARGFPALMPA